MFFALLGEHGWPGLFMYVAMIGLCFLALRRTVLLTRDSPEHRWAAALARSVQTCIAVIFACGMFVEIGWSPIVWYLFSLSVCLREYARRVTAKAPAATLGRDPRLAGRGDRAWLPDKIPDVGALGGQTVARSAPRVDAGTSLMRPFGRP